MITRVQVTVKDNDPAKPVTALKKESESWGESTKRTKINLTDAQVLEFDVEPVSPIERTAVALVLKALRS